MPRFAAFSDSPSTAGQYLLDRPAVGRTPNNRQASSVRLSCLSPDGSSVHSLFVKQCIIETRRLPLEENGEGRNDTTTEESSSDFPALIRTRLPEMIRSSLELDPPLELFCAEGEGTPTGKNTTDRRRKKNLPQLCIYTRKAVFLVQLAYTSPSANGGSSNISSHETQGEVVSVKEPFERFMMDTSYTNTIVRIRPAPQNAAGYAVLCPAASLAMLTENTDTNEYSLTLYHGNDERITTPLDFGMEELADPNEVVVDFCFAQSRALSIFPSLSVLFLKQSGDVLAASPIVFHGTIVARTLVKEGLEYLASEIKSLDRSTAKWRQCRAAQQYLLDVFPAGDARSHFATARIIGPNNPESASWPVQLQGPVLFSSAAEPGPSSLAIENFGRTDMVGFAIGKMENHVDFAIVSPTALLPRFAFESPNDGYDLDDAIFKLGALVERVALSKDGTTNHRARTNNASLLLVPDTVSDSLLHCATTNSVVTISTNAIRVTSRQLRGKGATGGAIRTTAWSCLEIADKALLGMVVADDVHLGQELIALLEDGSAIPVNVAESQCLHEMESVFQEASAQRGQLVLATPGAAGTSSSSSEEALQLMESTEPLYEVVEPLLKKVQSGLARMGKIVGTETSYKDITPDALAVALQLKERCDKEVVLPLMELKKAVARRQENLSLVISSQKQQLSELQQTVADLKGRMSSVGEKLETAESNAATLAQRSAAALQASQDLLPTITQAEYDYFQDIKRLDAKCSSLEKEMKRMTEAVAAQSKSIDKEQVAVKALDDEKVQQANAMLIDQGLTLEKTRERLDKSEKVLNDLISSAGIPRE